MNRLKELRQKNNLTLKELSEQLSERNVKISADALAKYERGDREPKMETWRKIADCFNVSIPSARGEIDTNKIQNILQTILFFNCSDDAVNLLKIDEFAGCDREDKKHIAISYLMLLIFQGLNIDPYNQFLLVVKKVANLLELEGNERDNFIKQGMSTADMPNQKHDIKAANELLNIYNQL